MTSHALLPSFPSDLPTAPISIISSASLLSHSPSATSSLLSACQTSGFFYLDLNDSIPGQALIAQSESLLSLAKKIFALPDNVKQSHHLEKGKSLFGYKAAGTVKATDPSARKDSTEFMNVAKDHVFGITETRSYPDEIWQEKALFEQFMKGCHGLGLEVLRALARELGLDDEETFVKSNRFDLPSGDHVRLTRKTALQEEGALGLPSHTDFGSVTVLFNWLGGLQIEDRREGMRGEWVWVRPLEGHAVVNLGDAMVKFTNGALKSAKHRVVPAPGEQGKHDRYSVVYFVRPHNEALMKASPEFENGGVVRPAGKFGEEEGKVYTAGEWMRQRAVQLGN